MGEGEGDVQITESCRPWLVGEWMGDLSLCGGNDIILRGTWWCCRRCRGRRWLLIRVGRRSPVVLAHYAT